MSKQLLTQQNADITPVIEKSNAGVLSLAKVKSTEVSAQNLKKNLQKKTVSEKDIQRLVDEKLEYLQWLLKYAKEKWVELRPRTEDMPSTFACGLWIDVQLYANQFLRWEIGMNDIPDDVFRPKYIYYDLEMLLENDKSILRELFAHEIWHAEVSNYKDILQVTKRAYENGLPRNLIASFFNGANEDPFIWRYVGGKSPVRKSGVRELYKKVWATTTHGEFDLRGKYKVDQLNSKLSYHWLNTDFPETYAMEIIVDDDVQEAYEKVLPFYDETITPIPDLPKRVERKNEIYLPILADLAQKDTQQQTLLEKIKEMLSSSYSWDNKQGSCIDVGNKDGWEKNIWNEKPLSIDSLKKRLWEDRVEKLMQEAQNSIDNMSEEEKQKLLQKTKNTINNDVRNKSDDTIKGLKITENVHGEPVVQPSGKDVAAEKEAKKLQKTLEEKIAIKEKSIAQANKIKQEANKIKSIKEVEQIKEVLENAQNVENEIERKKLLDELENKIEWLKIDRKMFLQNLQDQWFSESEESDYEEYMQLEDEIEPYTDEFICALEDYIPKLREYFIAGKHHSGQLYDIPLAARKIKMGHYDFYGRKDIKESIKVNLWVMLSVDVSSSMSERMVEVRKLAIFLWIVCEKLKIPFYVNAFWKAVKTVKLVNEEYVAQKGNFYRMTKNLENATNLEAAINDLLEQIWDKKIYNYQFEFLPIIITDGDPTQWEKLPEKLSKLTNNFWWLDIIFWLWMNASEKKNCSANFPKWKKIWFDDDAIGNILSVWKVELIDFLVDNKDRLFTHEDW